MGDKDVWIYIRKAGLSDVFSSKQIPRFQSKNGLEDLKKARTYLDRLINSYE